MKRLIFAVLTCLSLSANAAFYEQITTAVLDNDANGIAADQTTVGAGNLTLDGALVSGGVATLNEAQIVAIESTGNISGVTFTVTGTDADGASVNEDITGPNNSTVKSTKHFRTITQIAVDGAVGTNTEVGTLAADGMVTRSVHIAYRQQHFNMAAYAVLSAGTGTFGFEYTPDDPDGTYTDSYSWDGTWIDSDNIDPDTNTGTAVTTFTGPPRSVRGLVTTGSTTGVYVFTFVQGDTR